VFRAKSGAQVNNITLAGGNQFPKSRLIALPEGFSEKDLPAAARNHRPECAALIGTLCMRGTIGDGWMPIRYENAIVAFGKRQWLKIRDGLEKYGHARCDHDYEIGSKSFNYHLGAKYEGRPLVFQHTEDPRIIEAMDALRGVRTRGGVVIHTDEATG